MENYSKWDDEEIKSLFKFVEVKKYEGMPLIKIFAEYATKTLRHANSVRNYYYKELTCMQKDNSRANKLGVDLANHVISQSLPFSEKEEKDVVDQINHLLEKGYSVRRACLELSGGDISKMIRLQNKYRALTKPKHTKIESNINMGQVIKMQPKQPKITDEEIKALFLGLVRIVKKQEQETIRNEYENVLFGANQKLKFAVNELTEKQKTIERLQKNLSLIKNELQAKNQQIEDIKSLALKNKSASSILKKYFIQNASISEVFVKN